MGNVPALGESEKTIMKFSENEHNDSPTLSLGSRCRIAKDNSLVTTKAAFSIPIIPGRPCHARGPVPSIFDGAEKLFTFGGGWVQGIIDAIKRSSLIAEKRVFESAECRHASWNLNLLYLWLNLHRKFRPEERFLPPFRRGC